MNSTSKLKTTSQQAGSGDLSRALFEKIMSNSEDIGKMKLEPFNIQIVEKCRAMYRENDKLFIALEKAVLEQNK